jgi:hypothetical protein
MEEIDSLIQSLDDARAELKAVLADIDAYQEIYPHWTLKELNAHLAGWDDAVASSLRAHAGGQDPATPATLGIDVYNAESVETREALALEQILAECDLAREQLKAAIRALTPDKFQARLLVPWGQVMSVTRLVQVFIEHDREHAEEIAAIKKNFDRCHAA